MKNKLPTTFPKAKKKELEKIVKIIKDNTRIEMIILYGSYARGDFIEEEVSKERGTIFKSDFDLFLITRSKGWQEKVRQWTLDENNELRRNEDIKTFVEFAVDNIQFTNKMLRLGQYFHKDIYKEGIMLYDSGEFKLNQPREFQELEPKERLKQSEEFFKQYIRDARIKLEDLDSNFEKGSKQTTL
jgi:predicted nucleotidyltransferase